LQIGARGDTLTKIKTYRVRLEGLERKD